MYDSVTKNHVVTESKRGETLFSWVIVVATVHTDVPLHAHQLNTAFQVVI